MSKTTQKAKKNLEKEKRVNEAEEPEEVLKYAPMTYERREEIFSKEYLTNKEIAEIFGVGPCKGSSIIGDIKRKVGDRLNIKGKVHVQDYFDAFDLNPADYRPSTSIALAKELVSAAVAEFMKPLAMVSGGGGKEETSCLKP